MQAVEQVCYRFGSFLLDVGDRVLLCDGDPVRLEPKSFDVLACLVANAGHLVSKQNLVDAVWARAYVSDNSLTRCIHQVRAALGDNADRPEFIETVPGSGYRFIARVEKTAESAVAAVKPQSPDRRRRSFVAIAVLLVFAVAAALVVHWTKGLQEAPQIDRIAVLPLTNLTGEAGQEYFVQGVHEALVAELSRRAAIDVISRTSVMGFRDTELSVPEIAERLDVDAIIEGSVARVGDKITLTAQLIATNPERHLWAERYHRDTDQLFEITTDIVESIASQIAMELEPDAKTASVGTFSSEAQEAYLRGRFYFEQRSSDGYRMAREEFQRAIELDPDFAPPVAGLAHTYGSAAIFGLIDPAEGFPEARRLAQRAVKIDPSLADGHLILAGVSFYWDWDWSEAERRVSRVLDLNPNLANAHRLMSEIYSVTGRHAEALAAVERGRAIDPLPPTSQFKPSLILYLARDYQDAILRAEQSLRHYPAFWQGHWLLCLSFAATERFEEAVRSCQAAVEYSGDLPLAVGALGYALALAGQETAAIEIAAELEARSAAGYVSPTAIAIIYGAAGRSDDAMQYLQRAYELRDEQLIHAENAAEFDSLRSDSRFAAMREMMLGRPPDKAIIMTR